MLSRRQFLDGVAALAGAVGTFHAGQDLTAAHEERDVVIKRVRAGVLDVAYLEYGPADGEAVVLLHGFPYDVCSYAEVAPQLARAGRRVIVPYLRGYGTTRFLDGATPRVGQQAALGGDLVALLDALNCKRATLAGYDWGGRAACVVAALYPERVSALVSGGTGYNIQNSIEALKPVDPADEQLHWYWFYLNSERGERALTQNRATFCRHLWRTFSPTWHFDDATYRSTSASFDNPDFAAIVLHSYRYRIGAVPGDPSLEEVECRLSTSPSITVPTVVLEGGSDGVDPPAPPEKIAKHFTRLRQQTVLDGIGHNIPQEAPTIFAEAILEVRR